jgi:hypothetical protein
MTSRTVVAVTGALVVTAYAALLALDALVLDPLAAVPGKSLAQVYAGVDAAGNSVAQDVAAVLVVAGIGVALAVGVAVLALWDGLPAPAIAVLHLGLVVLGAFAAFQSTFFLGIDVADSFGTAGGTHSPWLAVLASTSLAALIAIPTVLFTEMVRTLRRIRADATA